MKILYQLAIALIFGILLTACKAPQISEYSGIGSPEETVPKAESDSGDQEKYKLSYESPFLMSMDKKTNREKWRVQIETLTCGSELLMRFHEDEAVFGAYGKVYFLNKETGEINSTFEMEGWATDILFIEEVGTVVSGLDKVYFVNSGHPRWIFYSHGFIEKITAFKQTLYVQNNEGDSGKIYALNANNGQVKWRKDGGKINEENKTIYFDSIKMSDDNKNYFYGDYIYSPSEPEIYMDPSEYIFAPPDELEIKKVIQGFCDMTALYDFFYPIGWSKDGKLAYLISYADEAAGFNIFDVFIQDLNSDKILWSLDSFRNEDLDSRIFRLPDIWEKNHTELINHFYEHEIYHQNRWTIPWKFQEFPFEHEGSKYDIQMEKEEVEVADSRRGHYPSKVRIYLTKNDKRKEIFHFEEQSPNGGGPYNVGVLGFIKSPYEPLLAVIIDQTYDGWEGPPDVHRLSFSGASLEDGFE